MVALVVALPFLLIYSCENKRSEESRKTQMKVEQEEMFRKTREANLLKNLSRTTTGYHPINRASDLAIGIVVHQKAMFDVEGPRGRPMPIGTVKAKGDGYVMLNRVSSAANLLGIGANTEIKEGPEALLRDADFQGGLYVTVESPELMSKYKEQVAKEGENEVLR